MKQIFAYIQVLRNSNFPMNRFNILLSSLATITFLSACEGFLSIDPPKDQVATITAFENDDVATSTITGVYNRMVSGNEGFASGGIRSITLLAGLSADELSNYNSNYVEFYTNDLLATNGLVSGYLWSEPYQFIYTANAVLENLPTASGVSEKTKKQLEGEAKFIRAFCYFYLVNLFGDVPIHTSTDYRINAVSNRSSASNVYQQIITDLVESQNLLSDDYITLERVRPNKWTAKALLARAYLFTGDWANAETISTEIINNTTMYSLSLNLNEVFLKNSSEAIWQLMPVTPGYNTNEGNLFILTSTPLFSTISDELLTSFEPGDNRASNWIASISIDGVEYYYPFKYKVQSGTELTEYSMVFRLGEQYLIRAEARAHQNNIDGATNDLNIIRTRAGLDITASSDQNSVLQAILQERKVELFAEWGHRWFDLKRFNESNIVLAPIKGSSWQSTDILYPIPQSERERNLNISQNDGY